MNVPLPAALQKFVNSLVASGAYGSRAEVVTDALRLLRARDRVRTAIDEGLNDLAEGRYTEYDADSLRRLPAEIAAEVRRARRRRKAG
jgi:putative addiction module CopG family antidote